MRSEKRKKYNEALHVLYNALKETEVTKRKVRLQLPKKALQQKKLHQNMQNIKCIIVVYYPIDSFYMQ